MVSVVCSLLAVSWFIENQAIAVNSKAGSTQKNNQNKNKAKLASNKKTVRAKVQQDNNEKHQKHSKHSIAGFIPADIDHSLATMTKKLAMSTAQQTEIRALLAQYAERHSLLRKSYMQTRKSLLTLDVNSENYSQDKTRLFDNVQDKFQQLLLFTLTAKENIYASLNTTQQEILRNIQ